jgi:hypothetical protein
VEKIERKSRLYDLLHFGEMLLLKVFFVGRLQSMALGSTKSSSSSTFFVRMTLGEEE